MCSSERGYFTMPYLTKDELKRVIISAFNEGIIAGVAMDHNENTPEMIFGTLDVDNFYEENFIIKNKHKKSKF
jgi:hypothetical protein